MNGTSHLLLATGMVASVVYQYSDGEITIPTLCAMGVGAMAGLFPDTDSQNPLIKGIVSGRGKPRFANSLFPPYARKKFPDALFYLIISIIEMVIRSILTLFLDAIPGIVVHRGPTHYLLASGIATAVVGGIEYLVSGSVGVFALATAVGYFSHIWADSMTKSGIPLFGPIYKKSIHALPKPYRVTTSRDKDYQAYEGMVVAILCAFFALALYFPTSSYTYELLLVALIVVSYILGTVFSQSHYNNLEDEKKGYNK